MDTALGFSGLRLRLPAFLTGETVKLLLLQSGTFTKTKGLRIYQDPALPLGVHPSALGVHANGNGRILVPRQSF